MESKIAAFYKEVKKNYPVKKMILFGSYAYGTPHQDSDIDLGVVIDLPKRTDRIKITADLFHLTLDVDTRIEPKTIFYKEYLHPTQGSVLEYIIKNGRVVAG